MMSAAKELNLTLLQMAALAELNHDASLSTADLARLTFVTPQNMSLTVSKLEAGGFLMRKAHPTNKRVNRLVLTPRGSKVLRRAAARASAIERQMFVDLSVKEKNALRDQLRTTLIRAELNPAKKTAGEAASSRTKRWR